MNEDLDRHLDWEDVETEEFRLKRSKYLEEKNNEFYKN
jgi:hypothetical protein